MDRGHTGSRGGKGGAGSRRVPSSSTDQAPIHSPIVVGVPVARSSDHTSASGCGRCSCLGSSRCCSGRGGRGSGLGKIFDARSGTVGSLSNNSRRDKVGVCEGTDCIEAIVDLIQLAA